MARARITLPPPPSVPPFPSWARARSMPKNPEETGFLAGAALAARHPIACHDHPIGVLWRQRLALANAAALARHAGRTEDEAALRPATAGAMPGIFAVRLRSRTRRPLVASLAAARRARSARPSDSPGAPAERLDAWIVGRARCLLMMRSRTSATLPRRWPQERGVRSRRPHGGVSLQKRPDAEALALWLADAVLATASDGRDADRRPDSAQRLGGGRPYDLVAVAGG